MRVCLGVEVGCGRFDGDHLAVVVGGEQNQVVAGVAAVVVHGGERDVAVVVKQDAGDAVLLVLDTVGGLVEEVEGELEFVVHDVFSVRVLSAALVSAGEAANRLRVGGQPRRVRGERSRVFGRARRREAPSGELA